MAYQRPFLISLKRDSQEPWGFRTFGGKEFGEPHIVEKVVEDSIAEQCGIREGDEIIQLGRMNIQDFTFGQVQEQLARSGNKIEMFVVREDLLSPRKGKEPSHVKAIVHNPYNSPLNLYSTENIAETLAKQTEVLTEGHVSSTEEEEAPENLSFKQKSAVFQLLEEQAKQESFNPNQSKPRKAPPPPPKAPPSAAQFYLNKENYSPHEHNYDSIQSQQHQNAYIEKDGDIYLKRSPTESEYKREGQKVSHHTVQSQKSVSFATANNYSTEHNQSPQYKSTYKATPSTDKQAAVSDSHLQQQYRSPHQQPQTREATFQQHTERQQFQQSNQQQCQPHQQQKQISQQQHWQNSQQQNWDSHSQRQQQIHQPQQQQIQSRKQTQQLHQQQIQSQTGQPQHQKIQSPKQTQQPQHHQFQPQQSHYQQSQQEQLQQQQRLQQPNQQRFQSEHPHKPQQMQHQQYQQMQQPQSENCDGVDNPATSSPVRYKAPPSHKVTPNWPPQNMAQQNGRWHSPSPTPSSPTKTIVAAAWPPKQPTVKDLPKTGFNPATIKEQGSGRRCVWPPQNPDDEFRSGRTTPQSPVTGRRIAWNPSPSPPLTRRSPFGSASPVRARKDIAWPPPQPIVHKSENHRPSPTLARKARLDDYVKQHATTNVPSTYRPPPGTQRVEFA